MPKKYQNITLLIFSLFFYAWGEPIYILLMIVSITFNYLFGLKVSNKNQKFWLMASIVFNLGLLAFFKYSGFLMVNIERFFNLGIDFRSPGLPLGISFFTFQSLSYLIDLYRGKTKVQKNIINLALYISLFPQLIAGPIVRYTDISRELIERRVNLTDIQDGCTRFVIGLSKKILIADKIGLIASNVISSGAWGESVYIAWFGVILYGLQIYYDFSGYSDMAIGLGRMFGFHFPENFNYPYISKSISEFWRRWHISLGSWFRDYLYIPLGGNRLGNLSTLRNLFIVWFLTGLWHGASWNFVVWGLYFGLFIALEKLLKIRFKIVSNNFIKWFYATVVVFSGWSLFFSDGLKNSLSYYKSLFFNNYIISEAIIDRLKYFVYDDWAPILMALIFVVPIIPTMHKLIKRYEIKIVDLRFAGVLGIILLYYVNITYLINSSFSPFIYFRF